MPQTRTFYAKYAKRPLDILCAAVALVALCWLYAIIALLVRLKLGSPVIYKAKRPGRIDPATGRERIFSLYKFRSMTNAVDAAGKPLPDAQRLTPFGRLLRATSLDELPELFNILKGDMSIVGPRPLAVSALPYFTPQERSRHNVRPGLTGLAQISGRNSLTWEEKFRFDLNYIHDLSFILDMKIILITVAKVLKREGIGQGEQAPVSISVERKNRIKQPSAEMSEESNNPRG